MRVYNSFTDMRCQYAVKTVQGGIASTAAMGKGVTEDQFKGT